MKNKLIIGLAVIALFSGFAFYAFSSSLNPYVTLAEAKEAGRKVQVIGDLKDADQINYNPESKLLQFYLEDEEGDVTLVTYDGAKPTNLDHAEGIVVVGYYNDGAFEAERLLVKCPSKYDEAKDDG